MKCIATFLFLTAFCLNFQAQGSRNVDSLKNQSKSNSLDSVWQRYLLSSVEALKPKKMKKPDVSLEKDSLTSRLKDQLKQSFHGDFLTEYHYGLLIGYIDSSSSQPLSMFRTAGDFTLDAFGLPFRLGFNYSTFQNPLGVNNYIRATVDVEKMRENAIAKKNASIENIKGEMLDLEKHKGMLKSKIGFGEVLQQRIKLELENQKIELAKQQKKYEAELAHKADSLKQAGIEQKPDSLHYDYGSELEKGQARKDSLQAQYEEQKARYEKYKAMYDSLQAIQQKIYAAYDTYDSYHKQLKEKKGELESLSQPTGEGLKSKALEHVKQFDLGLCYPQTTGLTNNSIPIKGINIETQKGNWYTAVSAGVTLNNLMVTNNVIQNQLQNTQNLFNQFDFQQVRSKRMIVMVQSGYGTKEGTHAFLTTRYTNKAISNEISLDTNQQVPGAMSIELDFRLKPAKFESVQFDLVYGKTSLNQLQADSSYAPILGSLFSGARTNMGLFKYTQQISKLRSNYSVSFRWIDPWADMASMGVLQANHVRVEVQSKHKIFPWLNAGLNVRKDQNNVARTQDSTLHLLTYGGNLVSTLSEQLQVIVSLQHVQQMQQQQQVRTIGNDNYMFSASAVYQFKLFKLQHAINASNNSYKLTTAFGDGSYQNTSLQLLSRLTTGQNKASVSHFNSFFNDSLSSAFIVGDEFSTSYKKLNVVVGLKYSISQQLSNDIGGKVELSYKFSSHFLGVLRAEKFVLGDFYTHFDPLRFSRFPYALMAQLNYRL